MEARRVLIHQSLSRQNLFLGGERDLVMLSALIAFLVGVGGFTPLSAVTAFIFWLLSLIALRKMAKYDPQLSKVYMSYINYQSFYPARSSKWRKIEGFKAK